MHGHGYQIRDDLLPTVFVDPLPTHMALLTVASTSFSSRLLRHPSLAAVLQITRSKSYDRFSEEAKSYADYRRGISAARKKFQDEWRSHQQMKMEGFNAQAAEEARLEREREEEALTENEKELERMRIERYAALTLTMFNCYARQCGPVGMKIMYEWFRQKAEKM